MYPSATITNSCLGFVVSCWTGPILSLPAPQHTLSWTSRQVSILSRHGIYTRKKLLYCLFCLQALGKIHDVGLLHGDVRAENVLLQDEGGAWKVGAGGGKQLLKPLQSEQMQAYDLIQQS